MGVRSPKPDDVKTGRKCVVCKAGEIVESFSSRHDPSTGPPIFGPGSQNQIKRFSDGFHCANCGISYFFVPDEKAYLSFHLSSEEPKS
ncbi:MAG: hypothetical protein G01um101420_626 [Parcubacteria group bacterium Gr01-1014_20]|nr:MAG: hypothetical protein G01um101420_626 [Parcubacteria group bacterium Gr01-1014_20]